MTVYDWTPWKLPDNLPSYARVYEGSADRPLRGGDVQRGNSPSFGISPTGAGLHVRLGLDAPVPTLSVLTSSSAVRARWATSPRQLRGDVAAALRFIEAEIHYRARLAEAQCSVLRCAQLPSKPWSTHELVIGPLILTHSPGLIAWYLGAGDRRRTPYRPGGWEDALSSIRDEAVKVLDAEHQAAEALLAHVREVVRWWEAAAAPPEACDPFWRHAGEVEPCTR